MSINGYSPSNDFNYLNKLEELQKVNQASNFANCLSNIQCQSKAKDDFALSIDSGLSKLENEFTSIQNEQGVIGKTWNGIKTLFGGGSKKIEKVLAQYKNNEITYNQASEQIIKYGDGQKTSVDVVGDILSGITSAGAAMLAPVFGGTSLLVAAGIGAGLKTAIKLADAKVAERKYGFKEFIYDIVTGAVNGFMSPITNGLGGAVGTGVAKVFGLRAVGQVTKETTEAAVMQVGKKVIQEGTQAASKGIIAKILSKQGAKYVLKEGAESTLKTSIGKIVSNGADMFIDGAISGATDGIARAIGEGKIEDIKTNAVSGFIGGALFSPVIGSGFKLAGGAANKLKNISRESFETISEKLTSGALTNTQCAMLMPFGFSKSFATKISELSDVQYQKMIELIQKRKYYTGTALQLAKLAPEQYNQAIELIGKNIPPSRAADTAVLMEKYALRINELIQNPRVEKYYVPDIATLPESQYRAVLNALEVDGANTPTALATVQGVAEQAKLNPQDEISMQDVLDKLQEAIKCKPRHPITPEVEEILTDYAQKFEAQFGDYLGDSREEMARALGAVIDGEQTIPTYKQMSGRVKGADSILCKLKAKYEKGDLIFSGDANADFQLAKALIADAFGLRLQLKHVNPEVLSQALNEQGIDEAYFRQQIQIYMDNPCQVLDERCASVINALKEAQTHDVFEALMTGIRKGDISISEINNYGNQLSAYFTEGQILELVDAFPEDGVFRKVVTQKSEIADGQFIQEQKAIKSSGYSTAQMNFTQSLRGDMTAYGELQIRGTEVNKFGEVEHIPYDIRQGKITPKNTEYSRIYGEIKNMTCEQYDKYNEYLTRVYTCLRLQELDYQIEIPKLDSSIGSELISYEGLLKLRH